MPQQTCEDKLSAVHDKLTEAQKAFDMQDYEAARNAVDAAVVIIESV